MTFDSLAQPRGRAVSPYFIWPGIVLILLFAVVFVIGGADGIGYSVVKNQAAFVAFLITVAPFAVGAVVGVIATRLIGHLWSINIPIQTASGPENRRVWIKPGSFEEGGDFCTWREGGREATVKREHLCQAGSIGGWYGCRVMNRTVSGGRVVYETNSAETTRSLIQHRRQRLAEQEAAELRAQRLKRFQVQEE